MASGGGRTPRKVLKWVRPITLRIRGHLVRGEVVERARHGPAQDLEDLEDERRELSSRHVDLEAGLQKQPNRIGELALQNMPVQLAVGVGEAVRELLHGAEVEHAEPAVGQDQVVARVGIGVHDALEQEGPEERRRQLAADAITLLGARRERGLEDLGQRPAVEVFQGEHVLGRQLVDDLGHDQLGKALEQLREAAAALGLAPVVDLLAQLGSDLVVVESPRRTARP